MITTLDLYRERFPRRDDESDLEYAERLAEEMDAGRPRRAGPATTPDARTAQYERLRRTGVNPDR